MELHRDVWLAAVLVVALLAARACVPALKYHLSPAAAERFDPAFESALAKHGLTRSCTRQGCDVYVPTARAHTVAAKAAPSQLVLHVSGDRFLTDRHHLWQLFEGAMGRAAAARWIPETFVVERDSCSGDFDALARRLTAPSGEDEYWVLKSERGGQAGILLTDRAGDLLEELQNNGLWVRTLAPGLATRRGLLRQKYAVVQRGVARPLTVARRCFRIQLYVAFVSRHRRTAAYVHRNGLVYWARDRMAVGSGGSPTAETRVASREQMRRGRTPEDVAARYAQYPQTLQGLVDRLQADGVDTHRVLSGVLALAKALSGVVQSHLGNQIAHASTINMYGMDVVVDSALRPWLVKVARAQPLADPTPAERCVRERAWEDLLRLERVVHDGAAQGFTLVHEQ